MLGVVSVISISQRTTPEWEGSTQHSFHRNVWKRDHGDDCAEAEEERWKLLEQWRVNLLGLP